MAALALMALALMALALMALAPDTPSPPEAPAPVVAVPALQLNDTEKAEADTGAAVWRAKLAEKHEPPSPDYAAASTAAAAAAAAFSTRDVSAVRAVCSVVVRRSIAAALSMPDVAANSPARRSIPSSNRFR